MFIAVLVTAMMFVAGKRLGMVEAVHARHAFYSIPYAISRLYFGASGYVILRDVAEPFISAYPGTVRQTGPPGVGDAQIQAALHVTPDRDRVMYFPADEKGDAAFVILAFRLFGVRIDSLYTTWFVLFSASVTLFVASFWRSPPRIALLALVLLAAHTAFFALPLTTELHTVQNPRAFGVVSLVAVLHLALLIIDGRPFRWSAGAAIAQAALITFSVYVRSTEVWQVFCVMGVAVFAGWHRGYARRLASAWPVAVLVLGLVALEAYQLRAFDPAYRSTKIRHRIFWHNVGIGFALNPMLAEKYGLSVDDAPMIRLVRQHLLETGRAAEIDAVFMPSGSDMRYYGIARDYVTYDRVAREVVLDIVRHDTWQALKTFIVYKPIVLWRQLAWATGFGQYSIRALYLEGQAEAVASDAQRRSRGLYLDLLRPDLWAGLIGVAAIGVWGRSGGAHESRPRARMLDGCSESRSEHDRVSDHPHAGCRPGYHDVRRVHSGGVAAFSGYAAPLRVGGSDAS